MTIEPEPYTGAIFTLWYHDMVDRSPWEGIGQMRTKKHSFQGAFNNLQTKSIVSVGLYPSFVEKWTRIKSRVELEYQYREINAETPDMWVLNCERKIAEMADRYEPVLKALESADLSDIGQGSTVTEYGSVIGSKLQETPYGELDDESEYTSSQSHVSRTGEDRVSVKGNTAEALMSLQRKYEGVENTIIKEFGELFIHTIALEGVL